MPASLPPQSWWLVPAPLFGMPVHPPAQRLKELRAVGNLALKVPAVLIDMKVIWTITDVVRIGYAEEFSAPVILWIGVMPGSLSGDDGIVVASKCKRLLEDHEIVDVEICESV